MTAANHGPGRASRAGGSAPDPPDPVPDPDAAPDRAPDLGPLDPALAARLRPDGAGLVAAIVQQHDTGEVLMLAWMDGEALRRTLATGLATYWSRSRQRYWVKGESSGHVQHVRSVALDCDGDALLVRVDQVGPACHTGTRTCFSDRVVHEAAGVGGPRTGGAGHE